MSGVAPRLIINELTGENIALQSVPQKSHLYEKHTILYS